MNSKTLAKPFLLILVILVTIACFILFRPFLTEILVAGALVGKFKGKQYLASLLMCLFLVIFIILPIIYAIIYAGQQSVDAYQKTVAFVNQNDITTTFKSKTWDKLYLLGDPNTIKNFALDIFKRSSDWLVGGATEVIKGTTNFLISLGIIIITMFFFFVSGKGMLKRLMHWSPLPDKYDVEIFQKFKNVSYYTMISTFAAGLAQALAGGIAFFFVGVPVLLPALLIALCSLLPILGSALIYIPIGLYLIFIGSVGKGIFILIWGSIVIGYVDNVVRALIIKGKAEVNPIFVILSILGGISLFGFWGIVLGPLVVSLAITIFHIYELEFCNADGTDLKPLLSDNPEEEKK